MLRFEPNVRIVTFTEQLARILHLAGNWAAVSGIGVVINSVDDGKHSDRTLHGFSLAADLDTEGDQAVHLTHLHGYLARHLPAPFDVLLEPTHVHVEYDTHRKLASVPPPGVKAAPAAPGTTGS